MKWHKVGLTLFLIVISIINAQAKFRLISATRIKVDARYDSVSNDSMSGILASYKARMGVDVYRRIGECAQLMTVQAPESLLSDFLADQVFLKANQLVPEGVDFSILNFGGIRATLKEGSINVSDIYKIMPFENELVILEVKGSDVLSVFRSVARNNGACVSNVMLEIKGDKINRLLIGGKVLESERIYRIATMDYLANGNSGMSAFLHAIKRTDTGLKIRDIYIEQIECLTAKGQKVDAQLDGRIKLMAE